MLTQAEVKTFSDKFLGAWNEQDVAKVVDCYTPDTVYRDPNTRGEVKGSDGMRRYLTKLFASWQMHWSLREAFPLDKLNGVAVLWHAKIGKPNGGPSVEVDGMDLVVIENDKIKRNEVYFDRAVLAPLLGM
ncbi:MAG: nuclear transport factor 2 family protein [Nitrospirae bacterium]|nr:nuclear transport factor 2 family protein [Nitrospirota bacterium]